MILPAPNLDIFRSSFGAGNHFGLKAEMQIKVLQWTLPWHSGTNSLSIKGLELDFYHLNSARQTESPSAWTCHVQSMSSRCQGALLAMQLWKNHGCVLPNVWQSGEDVPLQAQMHKWIQMAQTQDRQTWPSVRKVEIRTRTTKKQASLIPFYPTRKQNELPTDLWLSCPAVWCRNWTFDIVECISHRPQYKII